MVDQDMNKALYTKFPGDIASADGPLQVDPPFMTRVRLRAQRRVQWMRALWASMQSESHQGLAISHGEVDRILAGPGYMVESAATFYDNAAEPMFAEQVCAHDALAATDPQWGGLLQRFDLSSCEADLLSLTVAVDIDPMLRRVFGYLQDDATACYPTPWLAQGLFQWPPGEHIGPESQLVRRRLAHPADGISAPWSPLAPWVADPWIVSWIVKGDCIDPALGTAIEILSAEKTKETLCLYPAQLASMMSFIKDLRGTRDDVEPPKRSRIPIEIEIIGPDGSGKRTLAAQFCAAMGVDLICADAALLLGGDVPLMLAVERIERVERMACLLGGIVYWHGVDEVLPGVWRAARGLSDLVLLGAAGPSARDANREVAYHSFTLPPLTQATRIAFWNHLSDRPAPRPIIEWLLKPAEIAQGARVAAAGDEAVLEACRTSLFQGGEELFAPLVCPFTWDDIVLSSAVKRHLTEFEQQARLRWQVYEEWGFERLSPLGRGITAMFSGPSGTGKTMAAQVLAHSLGMKLYRVDLAGVMNKYIGETEKRLKRVFDACERANVVLFFDEADALFGQRTQVKDAHDRFANIEINYLLQRMEQFDGIAILATNRKSDLDKAFLRRIRFIVDFLQPGPAERFSIWQRVLPSKSPAGEELLDDIDWAFLATKLNMTGADITTAALSAAFLARAEGVRIGMKHILHAARREMIKHGVVLREGEWE
jgi:hypothetical protein